MPISPHVPTVRGNDSKVIPVAARFESGCEVSPCGKGSIKGAPKRGRMISMEDVAHLMRANVLEQGHRCENRFPVQEDSAVWGTASPSTADLPHIDLDRAQSKPSTDPAAHTLAVLDRLVSKPPHEQPSALCTPGPLRETNRHSELNCPSADRQGCPPDIDFCHLELVGSAEVHHCLATDKPASWRLRKQSGLSTPLRHDPRRLLPNRCRDAIVACSCGRRDSHMALTIDRQRQRCAMPATLNSILNGGSAKLYLVWRRAHFVNLTLARSRRADAIESRRSSGIPRIRSSRFTWRLISR